jgi:small subunit ribosomal protein S7
MPRKGGVVRREIPPDPVYGNPMVTRIISSLMVRGKRSLAERIFYQAIRRWKSGPGRSP